ncbi:mitochondrial ribosomal protein subunit-domain-containing protein [Lipomyces arxii]|uniref:mitochondrial 37S ribosomal protein bS1m n=1 Tax=Lipomyces arxii TaxID=56418 RepID=UPI0034CF564D
MYSVFSRETSRQLFNAAQVADLGAMSSHLHALLRHSRLFALPRKVGSSGGARTRHPTLQLITTSKGSQKRGEWGLKGPLPGRSKYVHAGRVVVQQLESPEGFTTFIPGEHYFRARKRFEEMAAPVLASQELVDRATRARNLNTQYMNDLSRAHEVTSTETLNENSAEDLTANLEQSSGVEGSKPNSAESGTQGKMAPSVDSVDAFAAVSKALGTPSTQLSTFATAMLNQISETKRERKSALFCDESDINLLDTELRTKPLLPGFAPVRLSELSKSKIKELTALAAAQRESFAKYLKKHNLSLKDSYNSEKFHEIKSHALHYLGVSFSDTFTTPITASGGLGYALRGRAVITPTQLSYSPTVRGRDLAVTRRHKQVAAGGFVAAAPTTQTSDRLQDVASRFSVSEYKIDSVQFTRMGDPSIRLQPLEAELFSSSRMVSPGVNTAPIEALDNSGLLAALTAEKKPNEGKEDLKDLYDSMLEDM